MRKEIVFAARDQGVDSTISKLRQSATALARDIAKESAQNSTTAKEATKYFEDQIKLIERRNKLDSDSRKLSTSHKYDEKIGAASGNDRKKLISDRSLELKKIESESKEDKLQTEILKELLAVTKSNLNEVKDDDSLAYRQEVLGRTGIGSEFARGGLGGSPGRSGGGGMYPYGSQFGGNAMDVIDNNAQGAAAQLMMMGARGTRGMGGFGRKIAPYAIGGAVLAGGIMSLATKDVDSQKQLFELSSIAGRSATSLRGGYRPGGGSLNYKAGIADEAASAGYTRDEFLNGIVQQSVQAYGSTKNMDQMALNLMKSRRGLGVDEGTAFSIANMSRTGNGANGSQIMDLLSSEFRRGGLIKDGDYSRSNALAQGVTSNYESMLMRSGRGSITNIAGLTSSLGSMGGKYKNDNYLSQTVGNIDAALANTSGDSGMFRMSMLAKNNPNLSMVELEAKAQQGLGAGDLPEILKQAKEFSGGNKDAEQAFLKQFGFDAQTAVDLTKAKDISAKTSAVKFGSTISRGEQIPSDEFKAVTDKISEGNQLLETLTNQITRFFTDLF